jgi:ribokinase
MFDVAVRSKLALMSGDRTGPTEASPNGTGSKGPNGTGSKGPNGTGSKGPSPSKGLGPDVVVFGQIARDLVLVIDTMPGASQSADVYQRRELLGGHGANQAVALAQLGLRPALAGVVGEDQIGQRLLTQARHDRVDVSAVIRRPGIRTALVVDIVDGSGHWRYLEDIPAEMLLTEGDVRTCRHLLLPGRWVSVQMQQPPAAVLAAVTGAEQAGCRVVLDGAPAEEHRTRLLAMADVLRADVRETERLAGFAVSTAAEAGKVASDLLLQGPSLVALAVAGVGNLIAWPEGQVILPLTDTQVVDTTGADDAFLAGLITALAQDGGPQRAARLAVAAAGATVGHPGGRPALTPRAMQDQLTLLAEGLAESVRR